MSRSSHAVSALASGRANFARQSRPGDGALPEEVAFLARCGFSVEALQGIAQRASRLGVTAEAVLVSDGALSEAAYYEHLAAFLDLRFAVDPPVFATGLDWTAAARAGVAPLMGGNWLFAPRGRALRQLIGRLPVDGHAHRMFLTSPGRFEAMVRDVFAEDMTRAASLGLSGTQPELSALRGVDARQKFAIVATAAAFAAGVVLSDALWMAACISFGACAFFAVLIRLTATWSGWRAPRGAETLLKDADLPTYTVVVALYREAAVVERLVAALDALDYPAEKLDVIFALEASDEDTCAALQARPTRLSHAILRVPDGAPRTKPRALNYALAFARGAHLVIFDAEDQPDPDQLRRAATAFVDGPDDLGCLQAALAIDNHRDGWLTRLFALDYAGLFDIFNPGLSELGLPIPLGGTSNHFRTQALRDIGGWDAWNVTEDADLGVRLARFGYVTQCLASTTWEEAPATLRNWFPQRRRWMKGWMQTLITHTRHPRKLVRQLGLVRALAVLAILAANTLGPLVGPCFMAYVIHDMIMGDLFAPQDLAGAIASTFWIVLALSGFSSIVLMTLAGMARRGLWSSIGYLALRPVHMLLTTLAAWAALWELFRRPFHWSKTQHGLARSSLRAGRAQDPA